VEITSCGLNGGPLVGSGEYEARIACNLMSRNGAVRYEFGVELGSEHPYFTQTGKDREDDPDQYIANMTDGSVAAFKYFEMEEPAKIGIRVRGRGEGVMKVSAGDEEIAAIPVVPAAQWTWFEAALKPVRGVLPLRFKYSGSQAVDFERFRID